MSPSGCVRSRWVNDVPEPEVRVITVFAETKMSLVCVVVKEAVLLKLLLPAPCATASRGLLVLIPLYSSTRMSGYVAPDVNVTLTAFVPGADWEMFA